jgi:crossover junction endodeoxyribonuclease RusA
MKLTLPYPPSANSLTAVVRGRRVKTREHRRYALVVARAASDVGVEVLQGPVVLRMDVYRPRKQGDLSNTIKAIEDALTGLAYCDDSQIVKIIARRFDDKLDPRVEVEVEVVSDG